MAPKQKKTRTMSDEHKAALAEGRNQGRAVRTYLEALEETKPKRGRKRTSESITKRLAAIETDLETSSPLDKLLLTQEKFNLEYELSTIGGSDIDLEAIEAAFIEAAGPYAERKGLGYDAFRAVGVTPRVLKAAGIQRSS